MRLLRIFVGREEECRAILTSELQENLAAISTISSLNRISLGSHQSPERFPSYRKYFCNGGGCKT